MTKELFNKFINNKCSAAELQTVVLWIQTEAPNVKGKEWGIKEWKNYVAEEHNANDDRLSAMLDKIHHRINTNNAEKASRRTGVKLWATWLTRAAAILLLPVTVFLFYIMSQPFQFSNTFTQAHIDTIEVIAPIGSKTVVHLEDGTVAYLNHGSKIKYPQKFIGKTREVQLTGEGYFEVAHNPKKPFIVSANNLRAKAIGTSFNVMAYPDENLFEATLVEGKVILEQACKNGTIKQFAEMKPGQNISVDLKTNKLTSNFGDVEKYTSWKDGKLIFKNESISQIARRLSRWYNVEIEFSDDTVKDYTYTVTFVDETIYQILDLMVLATPIRYSLHPREKMPDGTFSKQKITIGLKE